MINWDELRHIHVIRKLQEILGSWFFTDIFFVDEKGQFRNWEPGNRPEFKNSLTGILAAKEPGQQMLVQMALKCTEKVFKSEKSTLMCDGVLGPDRCLVSRI